MNAMTKGCLAGTGVCFISHEGEIFPCGYLPALAGDLRKQCFADIWNNSVVFNQLRDDDNLKGKCGCCEFRHVCMGCRARAFAATGDFLAEEPFCVYEPGTSGRMIQEIVRPRSRHSSRPFSLLRRVPQGARSFSSLFDDVSAPGIAQESAVLDHSHGLTDSWGIVVINARAP